MAKKKTATDAPAPVDPLAMEVAAKTPRLAGFIRTVNRVGVGTKHEITTGVIEARPDSRFFAYTSHDLQLDGSRALSDAPCTFDALSDSHATNVSTVDLST